MAATIDGPIVFENGTMLGAMSGLPAKMPFVIPEIVISASQSSNSLNRSRCDMSNSQHYNNNNNEDISAESTALLEGQQQQHQQEEAEFEQFVLNRTSSESNILESSIYSELQYPPSLSGGCVAGPQTAAGTVAPPSHTVVDMLNTSACSRSDSRQSKRTRRKGHKSKSKSSVVGVAVAGDAVAAAGAAPLGVADNYPPQYTAIFLDTHHHQMHGNATANAMGQLASAAASSPFLSAGSAVSTEAANYLQYHQYYQQRSMMANMGHHHPHSHLHHARRTLLDVAVPLAGGSAAAPGDGLNNLTSSSLSSAPNSAELSAPMGYSFRKWFARPSLPFVIGILALGGVACTLGGIVLGSTGLIEHSTQYLSAALLMIGIGVSLLVISGAIWRLSLPDDVDECPCFRRMETCRNCNSPHCTNRLLPGSYLYPEFQHRPPPPSYLTSLNEYAFVYHPSPHQAAAYATVRVNTPPPLYRSTYSLNTSASHALPAGMSLPPTSEYGALPPTAEDPTALLLTREAVSQTSFKEHDENCESQATRSLSCEAQTQSLFKEVELD